METTSEQKMQNPRPPALDRKHSKDHVADCEALKGG